MLLKLMEETVISEQENETNENSESPSKGNISEEVSHYFYIFHSFTNLHVRFKCAQCVTSCVLYCFQLIKISVEKQLKLAEQLVYKDADCQKLKKRFEEVDGNCRKWHDFALSLQSRVSDS